MARAIQRGPGTVLALPEHGASMHVMRPIPYHPRYLSHPEDVATEIAVVAYSETKMREATAVVVEAAGRIARPRTIVERIHGVKCDLGPHVAYVYCYPQVSA